MFTEDDISASTSSSGDTSDWIGFVHQVTLSLFASDNEDAEQNGKYIRALISTFTPGAEEDVEDVLGLYGDPHKDAIIADGVNKATFGTVSYLYQTGNGKFIVQPHDKELHDKLSLETEVPSVIRPNPNSTPKAEPSPT